MPAQEPGAPQSVGGLKARCQGGQRDTITDHGRELDHFRAEIHNIKTYAVNEGANTNCP